MSPSVNALIAQKRANALQRKHELALERIRNVPISRDEERCVSHDMPDIVLPMPPRIAETASRRRRFCFDKSERKTAMSESRRANKVGARLEADPGKAAELQQGQVPNEAALEARA